MVLVWIVPGVSVVARRSSSWDATSTPSPVTRTSTSMTSAPAATAARIIASVFAGPKWVLLAWAITSGLALRNRLTGHAWVMDRDAVQDVTVTIIAARRAARATEESLPMETTVSGRDVQHDSSDCRASRSDD